MAYTTEDFNQTRIPLILDKIPVGVTVIDLECHILYYNGNVSLASLYIFIVISYS